MSIKKNHALKITSLALLIGLFVTPTGFSAEMTPSSMVFDNANYTAEVEKAHENLHMLYGKSFDKSIPLGQREQARRDFFKASQDLNKKMHNRVMMLDPKQGASLSHTDILLSTHLLLMTSDMLSTLQQDVWENDPGLQ